MSCIKSMPVKVPGISNELKEKIEGRILEFEEKYEPLVVQGKGGYVEKIKKTDFLIAGIVNGVILIYWIFSLFL